MIEQRCSIYLLFIPVFINMVSFCFGCGVTLDVYLQELLHENSAKYFETVFGVKFGILSIVVLVFPIVAKTYNIRYLVIMFIPGWYLMLIVAILILAKETFGKSHRRVCSEYTKYKFSIFN